LTALELDAAKVRIMRSAPQRQPGLLALKKGNFMKSRVALVAVLALGVFMSGTGATLAVSGFADNGSASTAQYPGNNQHENKGHHVVEAAHAEGKNDCTNGSSNGSNGTSNKSGNCADATTTEAVPVETQAVQQVAVTGSGSSLPFTGFAAIPVLIIGLGLLGAGVAMRFRRRGDSTV
jgi:hypothetical protein